MNRRTPLFDWHTAHGARMVPFGGWDMPVQYTSVIDEHHAVRKAAGLFDISHMARLHFDADQLPLLEKVFTNSVANMKPGQVRYGLILNENGGILDDVLVYNWADRYSMVVNASNRDKISAWLKAQGAIFTDATEATAMIAVQGPNARDIVSKVLDVGVVDLKYYYAARTWYREQPCIVSRTGYTGEDGFEIIVDNSLAVACWDQCVALGAKPCGLGARDTLRLEAAMPLYGHELSESITPLHAGLNWAVKMDKNFIGRDALAKLGTAPTIRVGLVLDGKRAAREGSTLLAEGHPIGEVTSGSYVPTLEKSIAMANVPTKYSAPNTAITVDIRGSHVAATVVPLPFYKRQP